MRRRLLSLLMGGRYGRHTREALSDLPKLPVAMTPLQGGLAHKINADTSPWDVGQTAPAWPCLDATFDGSLVPCTSTEQQRKLLLQLQHQHQQRRCSHQANKKQCRSSQDQQQQQQGSTGRASLHTERTASGRLAGILQAATRGVLTRAEARRQATTGATAAAAAPAGEEGSWSGHEGSSSTSHPAGLSSGGANVSGSSSSTETGFRVLNTAQLLFKREVPLWRQTGFSRNQQRHLCCHRSFPLHPQQVKDSMCSRAYIGQYSASGDFYIAAYQDRRVRLYDTQRGWRLRKDVTTRMTRWTITDTCLSPDQRLLVYASISPVAFVVNVGSSYDLVSAGFGLPHDAVNSQTGSMHQSW
eukprot:GHRR01006144.1.p1 GENE.GHRR01006144.1~~GHRR01006144.1.p1  ORF type:complete len:357 (+),score=130.44 GHRR01006144.1:1113-2183(+)